MAQVDLTVQVDGGARVRFRSTEEIEPSGDAQLAIGLAPSMRLGAPLSVDRASQRLLESVARIQEILHCWDQGLRKVDVSAKAHPSAHGSDPRVGAFFSGGVDSFYTALTHREEITDLIFVHGFDFSLAHTAVRRRAARAARDVADELGMNLVEVETDYRTHLDRYLDWRLLHGPALAVVALLLQGRLQKVFVAASHTYHHLIPMGSHPLLDPLWSTERLEIVHDGADVDRPRKVAILAESDVAMRHLRVCWQNDEAGYNCGRCVKCLQTMVSLRLAGALDRCSTFPSELDTGRVARTRFRTESGRIFALENLAELEGSGRDPELERALRASLFLQPVWSGVQSLRNRAGRLRRGLRG